MSGVEFRPGLKITAFGRSLIDDLDAAEARTTLGVTETGADTAYAFRANNLSDLANAGTARTNLGLVAIASSGSASDLSAGTVPDARFPAALPALSGVNLTALNASNLGSGTVPDARFPATLPTASGVNLTALNASNVASGTLDNARLPAAISVTSLTASAAVTGLTAVFGNSSTQPTIAQTVLLRSTAVATKLGFTGLSANGSTDTEGAYFYLGGNATGTRDLFVADTAATVNSTNEGIRFRVGSGATPILLSAKLDDSAFGTLQIGSNALIHSTDILAGTSGGLIRLQGPTSINASFNTVTNIGTGSTTSAVGIGGGLNVVTINSATGLLLQIASATKLDYGSTVASTWTFAAPIAIVNGNNIQLGTSTGSSIGTGITQKLSVYGVTPIAQRAGAAQAAVATTGAVNITPYGFTTAAQADAIVTLVNELRAWAVAFGAIKGAA